jgi:hypothetical protein
MITFYQESQSYQLAGLPVCSWGMDTSILSFALPTGTLSILDEDSGFSGVGVSLITN